ncbi:tumor necrosis factor receptor superfamily member 27 [Ahaetulla prasina]|uniref:tumor necrosis factor receptor superfamily member 27 n=1 Tax=Ahaetulla prasina TaxID=499056 RepID=UPI002649D274|nr:tumor necrosis factor receptor superfamily member 27 [Ahaetulla prasina]
MEKGAALRLTLIIVTQVLASQSIANSMECREGEYLDDHGVCSPCKECGPGFELSKECGYGEGKEADCTPCQPRRFKDSWGPHGCKSCLSCALINRAQKSNCSTTSDATCGGCFPGFYSKTQIGGFQDLECVPCTKQTPSSEPQCLSRIGLEESSTEPAQDPALVVLTSSALALLALVLLTVAILYCQQFWKSQCQHVFLRSQNVSGQRVTFRTSAGPTGFHELPPDASSLDIRNFRSPYRPPEGPVGALQFIPGVDVSGSHLPHPQPDADWSKLVTVISKTPQTRSPLETQPLIETSGLHGCSFHGAFPRQRTAAEAWGPVGALQFIPGVDVSGSHLPHPQPDADWSKLVTVTSKTPQTRSPLETQPLIETSGLHGCSFHGGFSEGREDRSRGPDGPGQPSSDLPLLSSDLLEASWVELEMLGSVVISRGPAVLLVKEKQRVQHWWGKMGLLRVLQPSSCARESQHCWPHTPVECTELDLQRFSAWAGKGTAETRMAGKWKPTPEGSACPAAQAGHSLEAASVSCSSFQNRTLESGEPLQSSSSNVSLEQPPL